MIEPNIDSTLYPDRTGNFLTGPTNPIVPIGTPGFNEFDTSSILSGDTGISNKVSPTNYVALPQRSTGILAFNPGYVTQLAEQQAYRNWLSSIALEKQFSPETEAFRRQSMMGLTGDVMSGGQVMDPAVREQLMAGLMAQGQMGDIPYEQLPQNEMYDMVRQQVMADLQLGGQLDRETQNLVGRASAQRAGASGFLGGQVGRDISARDLGLTSMQLAQQRRGAASAVAQQDMAQATQQQGFKATLNQMNQQLAAQRAGTQLQFGTMLTGADQQALSNRMGLAAFGQSIERPVGGIDPGALASAYIADVNAQNQLMGQFEMADRQASAAKSAATTQLFGTIAGAAAGAAIMCWVAREVYGVDNPKWMVFRQWLLLDAPRWLYKLYMKHGQQFADWLHTKQGIGGKTMRWAIRKAMDQVVNQKQVEVVWQ